ncbi:MAG: NUDIX hydrolase [Kiloniellaceae bacterium]
MDSDALSLQEFSGAKIALLCDGRLVVYRRDDKPTIPWPGLWDLPGGGREGGETPADCALRETREEFGLSLPPDRIAWCRRYPGMLDPRTSSYFLAAEISAAEVAAVRFGEEGQYWRMMAVQDFLGLPDAITHLQRRLADYLAERA